MYVWKELYYYFYIEKHKFQHIFENIFTFKQFLEILSKIITWKVFDNKFSKLCKLQRMNSFSSANIVPKAKGAQIPWIMIHPGLSGPVWVYLDLSGSDRVCPSLSWSVRVRLPLQHVKTTEKLSKNIQSGKKEA